MIKSEYFLTRKDGVKLIKTYSDEGFMIQNTETNEVFSEAIDPDNSGRVYIETDKKIENNIELEQNAETIQENIEQ